MFPVAQNSVTNLAQALSQPKVNMTPGSGAGKAFIKFDYKSGSFIFGRDAEDITGEQIAVNAYSFQHGWVLWEEDRKQPIKVMTSFANPLPDAPQGHGTPDEARGFEARFTDDPDTILVFEGSSFGIRKGVDALLAECVARSQMGEQNFLFPVVVLESESYKSQHGSKIHNPTFRVVAWMNAQGESVAVDAPVQKAVEHQPEPQAAPTRRRRNAAA